MFGSSTSSESSDRYSNSTKWRSNNTKVAPNCPRCASSNTKFCYYNNYSLSQPRYFCKACRRYWTKGGSLRNVPVGGGCRKSRRARRSPNHMVPSPGTPSADESSGGACIDIAAVFAKYVNQDLGMEESYSPGYSTGSSGNAQGSSVYEIDSRLEDITTTFEYKKPLGLINVGDEEVVPEVSTCHDITSQQLVYQDSDGLELQQQVVLCDAMSPDILWAECTTPVLDSGFEQLMVQGENCELFTPDHDQLRISQSLVTDHWDYFDISAYDF